MGPIASASDLGAALWRQRWLVALVLAVGLPLAVLFAASRPKVFEATAVVQIEPPQVAEAAGAAGAVAGGLGANAQLDLIQQRLLSRDTVTALVDRLGLFPDEPSPSRRVALTRGAVTVTKLVDPAQAWRPDVQPSGLVIAARLNDPDRAAALANALVQEVVGEAQRRAATVTAQTLAFLREEEARLSAEVATVEDGIADLRARNLASLPEALTAQRERLTSLNESRIELDRQAFELESEAGRLRDDEAARRRALLEEERGVIAAAIAETEAALAAAPDVERQLGAMTRRLDALEDELAVVSGDRRDAEVAERLERSEQAGRYAVLETAVPPDAPVSASRRKLAGAAGVAVAVLALGLALAREVTRPAIRTAAQMRRSLGVEALVVVPRIATRAGAMRRRLEVVALGIALLAGAAAAVALARGGAQAALDRLPRGEARG